MKKVLITILCIIMLFITIIQIRNTFALYKAEIDGEIQSLLGVWSIKVNEQDISSGAADMTFNITEDYLHFEQTNDVAANYIAPGSEGYFELLIDAIESDVAVRYDVQIDNVTSVKIGDEVVELSEEIEIELKNIEDIFEKDGEIDTTTEHKTYLDSENKTVSGVIPMSVIEAEHKNRVKIYFKWVNDDDNSQIDTMLGNGQIGNMLGYSFGDTDIDTALINREKSPSLIIPVHLQVTQYMGEELNVQVASP